VSASDLGKRAWLPALTASAALALAGATAGCGAPTAAASHRAATPAVRLAAGHRRLDTGRHTAGQPRYFADIVRVSGSVAGAGPVQIRSSATGALVPRQPSIDALGIAAYGGGSRLVLARQVGDSCTTRLYRATLSTDGRLGGLTRLGPVIRGLVTSVAADSGGSLIGYFAGPCSKSASGYLAVLAARTGHVRRWTGVAVYGSGGTLATGNALSESANGRLLAFGGAATGAGGRVTGQRVWVLRTSAAAGPIARRVRAVISKPATGPALSAAVLNPDGRSFYLCTVAAIGTVSAHKTVKQAVVITARRTSDGTSTGTVAKLTATGVTFLGRSFGCPLAMTPNGHYLLAPYRLHYGPSTTVPPLVSAAVIGTSSHARRSISFRLPGSAGMSVADGVFVAW
jgi:hypothetical protein